MKFGGTSVADIERIRHVATLVKREVERGNKVAVVVSAMAGETNKLVAWTNDAAKPEGSNRTALPDQREYDVVVAAGEQITAGLLSITLNAMGLKARSWLGWQVPIQTSAVHGSARIEGVPAADMKRAIEDGEVAVVAGFQGAPFPPTGCGRRRRPAAPPSRSGRRARTRGPWPARWSAGRPAPFRPDRAGSDR